MDSVLPESGSDLLKVSLLFRKAAKQVAQSAGLTIDEAHCLNLLRVERIWCVKKLRELVGLTPTRTSKLLRSLEEGGFVSRSLSRVDRRMELISLTEKGAQLAERLLTISNDVGKQLFSSSPTSKERTETRFVESND
jgi:DNA-binding MarR family transcriptional regulator